MVALSPSRSSSASWPGVRSARASTSLVRIGELGLSKVVSMLASSEYRRSPMVIWRIFWLFPLWMTIAGGWSPGVSRCSSRVSVSVQARAAVDGCSLALIAVW